MDDKPVEPSSPWPEKPSWGFATFTVVLMAAALFLIWWLNDRAVRAQQQKAKPQARADAVLYDDDFSRIKDIVGIDSAFE